MNRLFLFMVFLAFICSGSQASAGWKRLPLSKQKAKKQLQPRKYALVVGINQTRRPYWTPLHFARHDAIRVAKTLVRVAQFDHVQLHTRQHFTTKQAIIQSLKALKKRSKHPLDTIFVYFSAHGTIARKKKGKQRYIVTSDTTKDVLGTGLPVQQILGLLKQLPSKHIVLMLATCYTGTPQSKSRAIPGRKGSQMKGVRPLKTRAIQILSASGFAQAAYESTKLKSDVYTHFFLDCLHKLKRKGASVSAIDAHICAAKPTTAFVKKHKDQIQVPRVDSQPGANKDIHLFQKRKWKPAVGYFWVGRKRRHVRYQLRRRAHSKGFHQRIHSARPGEYIGLRPGTYEVTVRSIGGYVLERYTITIRHNRLTQLRQENLLTLSKELQSKLQGLSILRGFGYTMAGVSLFSGSIALLVGWGNDNITSTFAGGLLTGFGVITFCFLGMADLATQKQIRLLRYKIQLSHEEITPGFSSHPTQTPYSKRSSPMLKIPAGTTTTLLHTTGGTL